MEASNNPHPVPSNKNWSHWNWSKMSFFFLNLREEELEAKTQIGRMGGEIKVMVTEERWLREGEEGR